MKTKTEENCFELECPSCHRINYLSSWECFSNIHSCDYCEQEFEIELIDEIEDGAFIFGVIHE